MSKLFLIFVNFNLKKNSYERDVGVRASEILAKQELKDKDAVNVLTKTLLYDK